MRKSALFVRIFSVVVLMILMTVLLTMLIYTTISRYFFTQIKENELRPKAFGVSRLIDSYLNSQLGVADIRALLSELSVDEASDSLLGAQMVVVDMHGNELFVSSKLDEDKENRQHMLELARTVLERGPISGSREPSMRDSSWVCVGVPIKSGDYQLGAILLTVRLVEAMIAMGSLYNALMISLMLSLPLVAVILYYVIGRIVNPLRQMRLVARKMAAGDFSQRADDSQRGEVGELGGTLNYLSDRLSDTIGTLVLERNRLQQTINGLSEGIVAVDRTMATTHVNPAVKRLGIDVLLPLDDDFRTAIDTGEQVSRKFERNGRAIQMTISPVHDELSEIAGAVALFSDITERERLDRTRRDYVANVSHEMRTPLTAMRALLEPLGEGMVPSEDTKKRYYSIMMRETLRLSRLIDDLMELSRLQSGTLLLSAEPVALSGVFEEIRSKYEPVAEEHGQVFELDASLSNCPKVLSNGDRVEQVLVILIDNAIKYTPEGGSVRLSASWDEERVTLSVQDTGIGIDPADLPYVFDRFYKVDKSHGGLGSGLGLSIASELLQLMGEEISVHSEPGKGSRFSFTLKRA